jgi:chromatin assembly factor 1 subunit B
MMNFYYILKEFNKGSENVDPSAETLFLLPYRLVFAIATEDSLQIYDTQHLVPFAYLTGVHYSNITDLSW